MRLIDADALNDKRFHDLPYTHITPHDCEAESYKRGWNDAIDAIVECEPTAQPQQKTGRWISERREWEYTLRCSECGYTYTPRGLEDGTLDQADIHHYCPLCGTKMDRW